MVTTRRQLKPKLHRRTLEPFDPILFLRFPQAVYRGRIGVLLSQRSFGERSRLGGAVKGD